MVRSTALILTSLASVLLGCAAGTSVRRVAAAGDLPPRLAFLPLSRSALPPELAETLRQRLGAAFEQRGYLRLDDAWVDQRLALAGMQPQDPDWIDFDERLAAFGRANDIPGLVILEGFAADSLTTGVYNTRSLMGRLRVLDTAKGASTWTWHLDSNEMGGALLQSGQIFDAISDTIDHTERANVVRFASLMALAASDDLPVNPVPQPHGSRPVIDNVRADAGRGAGAPIEVVVTGAPGCRAFASLPGCLGRYPLSEEAPGRYAGALPVPKPAQEVIVLLRDRYGVTSRPMNVAVGVALAGGAR
jgi:hypothetical protein